MRRCESVDIAPYLLVSSRRISRVHKHISSLFSSSLLLSLGAGAYQTSRPRG